MQILVECRKNGILRFMLVRMEQIQLKEMYECEGRMSITKTILNILNVYPNPENMPARNDHEYPKGRQKIHYTRLLTMGYSGFL